MTNINRRTAIFGALTTMGTLATAGAVVAAETQDPMPELVADLMAHMKAAKFEPDTPSEEEWHRVMHEMMERMNEMPVISSAGAVAALDFVVYEGSGICLEEWHIDLLTRVRDFYAMGAAHA